MPIFDDYEPSKSKYSHIYTDNNVKVAIRFIISIISWVILLPVRIVITAIGVPVQFLLMSSNWLNNNLECYRMAQDGIKSLWHWLITNHGWEEFFDGMGFHDER